MPSPLKLPTKLQPQPDLLFDLGLLLILMKLILKQIHVHINLVRRDQVKSG